MNILFTEKSASLFTNMELPILSEYFLNLEKFQVKSLSTYFESLKLIINTSLKSLDISTHFNLLYIQTRLNQEFAILTSPLYITFLLKVNEKIFEKEQGINAIKLAWTMAYYSNLDLTSNVVFEESLNNMINLLRKNSEWVTQYNVDLILDVVIMLDNLKLFDIKIPKNIVEFFDKEIITGLISYHMNYNNSNVGKLKILDLLSKEKNLKFVANKLTNVFYIDAILEISEKVKFFLSYFRLIKFIE